MIHATDLLGDLYFHMDVTIQREDTSDICSICCESLTNTRVFTSSVSQDHVMSRAVSTSHCTNHASCPQVTPFNIFGNASDTPCTPAFIVLNETPHKSRSKSTFPSTQRDPMLAKLPSTYYGGSFKPTGRTPHSTSSYAVLSLPRDFNSSTSISSRMRWLSPMQSSTSGLVSDGAGCAMCE